MQYEDVIGNIADYKIPLVFYKVVSVNLKCFCWLDGAIQNS